MAGCGVVTVHYLSKQCSCGAAESVHAGTAITQSPPKLEASVGQAVERRQLEEEG